MVITDYDLKKKLAEIQKQSRYTNIVSNKQGGGLLEEPGTVALTVENIIKVNGDYVITDKGNKAQLFNPAPCIFWKCISKPDNNGDITLKKALKGLFINDGSSIYCLGVAGASDEFEPRLHVGNNEIRLNNSFLNISAPHLIINGVEEEK